MSDCGLMIAGPKGVGKTTSLYYLFHRLRETGALIVLSSASVMRTPSNRLKYHLENVLKEGKYYVIQMIVNYCISVTDNAELLEKCNWNKNVEDNLKMIIGSSSPEKKRYLLLDAGILSDREKMESLYSLAKWGVMKGWIVVLATSSGQGWTASIKNQNTMAELMCIVHTQLSKVEILL